MTTSTTDISSNKSDSKQYIHFILLVHGWCGNTKGLGYLEEQIQNHVPPSTTACRFVIRNAHSNVGRTNDGIVAGGRRLVEEIQSWIRQEVSIDSNAHHVTLSLVAHSLGGLYCRYAISLLWPQDDTSNNPLPCDVQPLLFVTTSTPHLGVPPQDQHVLPTWAQSFLARKCRQTGLDLHLDLTLIHQMATDPAFLQPLARFAQRKAYANAYGTDFQVHTDTAAILTRNDDQQRHWTLPTQHAMEVLRVSTIPPESTTLEDTTVDETTKNKSPQEEMAKRLNALGWIKVFCDVRTQLWSTRKLPFWNLYKTSEQNGDAQSKELPKEWTSGRQLLDFVETPPDDTDVYVPLGHTVLVASSMNPLFSYINRGGRPIMTQLAHELIHDILVFSSPHKDHSNTTTTAHDKETTVGPI